MVSIQLLKGCMSIKSETIIFKKSTFQTNTYSSDTIVNDS